ncbi:MAG TPA: type III pantothenate kinase, partial [Daejeonella sp.]|nr:type III pantothenate kinase [Daejeonella sp.]
MANLVIDIGNSRTKLAVFNNREICHLAIQDLKDHGWLHPLITRFGISNSIVSSVNTDISQLETDLRQKTNYIRFLPAEQRSVNITYLTPDTLGLDRLANLIGAQFLYPNKSCLVIDAGTCITYDLVDSEGGFSGGSISPGLNMRFKAMHTFTGRLPVVSPDPNFTGSQRIDTISSMISGVQNDIVSEVKGFIESYHLR